MTWKTVRIADLGRVVTGNTPPKKNPDFYGDDYPFIKPTDMRIGERYTPVTEENYSNLAFEKYKKSLIPPLSTCVVTIGSIGKKMTLTSEHCFVNQAVNAIIPSTKYNPYFVFYAVKNILQKVKKADTGASSGRENVSKSNFMSLTLQVPESIEQQNTIARLLGSFDDLIENNQRRINLLEQAAQNIYKEWFVNMRFPGYQNSVINEETALPEGWNKDMVTQYFDFQRGVEVGSKNYVSRQSENTVPFLRVGSLKERKTDIYTDLSLVKNRILEPRDLCVSMDGSIGLVGFGLSGAYSSGLQKVDSKDGKYCNGFIYCLLNSDEIQNTIKSYAKGSTILHASSSIKHMKFNNAPSDISSEFNNIIEPIFSQMLILLEENNRLKDLRDLLLPRLMNQTIKV